MASQLNLLAALRGGDDDEWQRQRKDTLFSDEIDDVVCNLANERKYGQSIIVNKSHSNLLLAASSHMAISKFSPNKNLSVQDKNSQMNEQYVEYMDESERSCDDPDNMTLFNVNARQYETSSNQFCKKSHMTLNKGQDQDGKTDKYSENDDREVRGFYQLSFNNSQHFLMNNMNQHEGDDVSPHSKVSQEPDVNAPRNVNTQNNQKASYGTMTFFGFTQATAEYDEESNRLPLLGQDDEYHRDNEYTNSMINPQEPDYQQPRSPLTKKRPTAAGGFYWAQFRKRQKLNKEERTKGTPFFSADQMVEDESAGPWYQCKCSFGSLFFILFIAFSFGLVIQYLVKQGLDEESVVNPAVSALTAETLSIEYIGSADQQVK